MASLSRRRRCCCHALFLLLLSSALFNNKSNSFVSAATPPRRRELFPSRRQLQDHVENERITDRTLIKFHQDDTQTYEELLANVELVREKMRCSKALPIFPCDGKHGEDHRKGGLCPWFTFDCASAAGLDGSDARPGQGSQAAISELQNLYDRRELGDIPMVYVDPEFVIEQTRVVEGLLPEDDDGNNMEKLSNHQHERELTVTTSDTHFGNQKFLKTAKVDAAWQIMNDNDAWDEADQIICHVLDSGWDLTHEDAGGNLWKNPGEICGDGIDNDGNNYTDDCHGYNHADDTGTDLVGDDNHGSHCSGTIAADTDNFIGVAGVAGGLGGKPGVSIMLSVGFGKFGNGGFAQAIVYAADHGAHISSNSWGYQTPNVYDQAVLDAIDYAVERGTLVVWAAGNYGSDEDYYPGVHENVIAVAAVKNDKQAAFFSNYGTHIDISAPGWNVRSTGLDNTYPYKSGTSMATPVVSGVLAMGKALHPDATIGQLKNCLYTTAEPIDDIQEETKYVGKLGHGLMDAEAFLNCVNDLKPPPDTDAPTKAPTTPSPTDAPTKLPTKAPTSPSPTDKPTKAPTTDTPTPRPTPAPTRPPTTGVPTPLPTPQPTRAPTVSPSSHPSFRPTTVPSTQPSTAPSVSPTAPPSTQPTSVPSSQPSSSPTASPNATPVPTASPSSSPSSSPVAATSDTDPSTTTTTLSPVASPLPKLVGEAVVLSTGSNSLPAVDPARETDDSRQAPASGTTLAYLSLSALVSVTLFNVALLATG